MLQKRRLVCRLAALLILRSVGILSTVFLSVYVSTVGLLGVLVTVFGLAKAGPYLQSLSPGTNVNKNYRSSNTHVSPRFRKPNVRRSYSILSFCFKISNVRIEISPKETKPIPKILSLLPRI